MQRRQRQEGGGRAFAAEDREVGRCSHPLHSVDAIEVRGRRPLCAEYLVAGAKVERRDVTYLQWFRQQAAALGLELRLVGLQSLWCPCWAVSLCTSVGEPWGDLEQPEGSQSS